MMERYIQSKRGIECFRGEREIQRLYWVTLNKDLKSGRGDQGDYRSGKKKQHVQSP